MQVALLSYGVAADIGDAARLKRAGSFEELGRGAGARRIDRKDIDPPRAGSTPEFLEAACALKPRHITYISCNPATQERDLHQLLDGGYRLLKITPVDMFPHTDHTETVAVLERR